MNALLGWHSAKDACFYLDAWRGRELSQSCIDIFWRARFLSASGYATPLSQEFSVCSGSNVGPRSHRLVSAKRAADAWYS